MEYLHSYYAHSVSAFQDMCLHPGFSHDVLLSMYWFVTASYRQKDEWKWFKYGLRIKLWVSSKARIFRSVFSFWKTHQCCWWGSCEVGVKNLWKVSVCPRKLLNLGVNLGRFMVSRWNQVMLKFSWGFNTRWNMLLILRFSFEHCVWTPKKRLFWGGCKLPPDGKG